MGRPIRSLSRVSAMAFLTVFLCLNGAGWLLVGRKLVHAGEPAALPVRIAAALPTQGIASADRLVIVFTDAVIAGPGAGEDLPSLESAPFALTPPVSGRWEWETTSRLAFLPTEPLGLCRRIVMRPTAELEHVTGRPVAAGMEALYATDPLTVTEVRVAASDSSDVTLELQFNADVKAAVLKNALSVRSPGRAPLTVKVLGSSSRSSHRVHLKRPADTDLQVSVARGLSPARGERGLEKDHKELILIPTHFSVVSTGTEIFRNRAGGTLRVNFNAPLDSGQESLPITVTPDVPGFTSRTNRHRIILEGSFKPLTSYIVNVEGSVLSAGGETLGDDVRLELTTPRRYPSLVIPHSDGILSPAGNLALRVLVGDIDAVQVTAHRVLPGNVVEHVRGEYTNHTSRRVVSEVFELPPVADDGDPIQLHVLDLASLFGDIAGSARGIYEVHVANTSNRWISDTATLRITDLAPTAKRDRNGVHVWVRALSTGESIARARVRVLTVTDQTLGGSETNLDGHAFIETPAADASGEPYVVIVESGDGNSADLAYLQLSGQRWNIPREVARGRAVPETADVFLYPERNLYRPGDTVHLTAIARSPDGVIHQQPIRVVVERPDGVTTLDRTVTPDPAQGLVHLDMPTSPDARTGVWRLRAEDPISGDTIGRSAFSVEAFLPTRIEVNASAEVSDSSGRAESRILARSLAGTSVESFAATLAVRWSPRSPSFDAYPLFTFRPAEDERSTVRGDAETELEADGSAQLELPGQETLDPGLWEARAEWTVTEPGSRSSVAVARVFRDTAAMHLGLRVDRQENIDLGARDPDTGGASAVAAGQAFHALGLAVDPSGTRVDPGTLWFVLERVDSDYTLKRAGQSMRWESRQAIRAIWSGPGEVRTDATGNVFAAASIICPTVGCYRLTIKTAASDAAPVRTKFWATDGDPARFEPPQEDAELVTLTASTNSVRPGETVAVQLRAPIDGAALVTLEDSRLRWYQQVTVVDGTAEVEVPIPADVRGGVTVTCQVTRPLDAARSSWTPHRAYGFLRIDTSHADAAVDVAIEAPDRVRPGDKASISVSAGVRAADGPASHAVVHLWAVDEGIRLAGGHRLPDPSGHFFGSRAYGGVTTDAWFDLIPDLELAGIVSRIGGDGDLPGTARRRAPERVHTRPGVVWLEATQLDENGHAHFDIETPEFTGELTWMAVVVDGDRYGSTSATTRLAGEVPMLVSLPRFAAPGDRFQVPMRFENQTQEPVTVTPRLELTGPVRQLFDGKPFASPVEASFGPEMDRNADTVTLLPGENAVHWFELEATWSGRIGGQAVLEGTFQNGRVAYESAAIDVPVRSGRPLVVASATRKFDAANTAAEILDGAQMLGLVRGTELTSGTLTVSSDLGIGLAPAGRYLTDYPHGCAEQTASRIWALLAMPELASASDDPATVAAEVHARVNAGIARLHMLQTEDGGIAYWPGYDHPSPWASAYVAVLLQAAQELEYEIPPGLKDGLCDYLEDQLGAEQTIVARASIASGLVVLGRPQPGWTRRLAEQAEQLGPGGRALVARAFAVEGETDRALALILDERPAPGTDRSDSPFGRLISPTRTAAIRLRVLLDIAPENERVVGIARALEDSRRAASGRWGNTVDNAAALVALARFHRTVKSTPADWTVRIQPEGGAVFESDSGSVGVLQLEEPSAVLSIAVEGEGPLFVTITLEGRAREDEPIRDTGLVVRRRWLDRNGALVDKDSVPVGDLIFVEIMLAAQTDTPIRNVAIVDPLPGGFEVESPRLSEADTAAPRSGRRTGRADRVEFLDDRVLIFTSALGKARTYRYALRAVAPGAYEHGPVQAEAMYAPEVSSIGSQTTRVRVTR